MKLSCTVKKFGVVCTKRIFEIDRQSFHISFGDFDIVVSDREDSFAETNSEKMAVFLDRLNGRLTGDEVDFLTKLVHP